MNDPWHDRTLALAGIFQAARLTQQLAREGRTDAQAFRASVQSILRLDAPDTAAVFGGVAGVALGLGVLGERLGTSHEPLDFELARYAINLIQLERELERRDDMQDAIRRGIEAAESQMKFFESASALHHKPGRTSEASRDTESARGPRLDPIGETAIEDKEDAHPRLIEKLAEIYSQTLSTLSPRILVNGEHGHLSNPLIAAKVRAALLAGIRAAFLWRQLGGRRWQLLLQRRRIIGTARKWLDDVNCEK